jgi:hypothetical protein
MSLSFATEESIENYAERKMDRLDRLWMNGALTQEQYDDAVDKLEHETQAAYREMRKRDARAWEGRSIFQHSWDGA